MLLKHLYILSALVLFSSCEKEIRVIKNPKIYPKTNITPQQYAIFYAEDIPNEMELRNENLRYYSLRIDGLEQEIVFEDGTPVSGDRFNSYLPTKKGILVSMRSDDGDKLYHLENGKTLKFIDSINMRYNYYQLEKGYVNVDQKIQYFCSQSKLVGWNNESNSLMLVKDNVQNCNGNQVKDTFYFTETINDCEMTGCGRDVILAKAKENNGSFQIQTLETKTLASDEYYSYDQFFEFEDSVAFKFYHGNQPDVGTSLGIRKINKLSGEISNLFFHQEVAGDYSNLNLLNNGNLFNGKIVYQLTTNVSADPLEIYSDDNEDYIYTSTRADNIYFGEISNTDHLILASFEGVRQGYFGMLASEDSLFILKNDGKFYNDPNLGYYQTYYESSLLEMNNEKTLIYNFGNLSKKSYVNTHSIKGVNYLSYTTPQEDGSHLMSLYILPTENSELRTDPRFHLRNYSNLFFMGFYDKVLVQTETRNNGERVSSIGFFGDDGIIRLINKIKAALGIYDT